MVVTGTTYAIGGVEVDEITFTNTYSAAPTSVTLEAFKAITGKVLNAGDFTFVLAGDADQSKTNNADGTVRFDAIEYAETGTYEYTINETPGDTGGVTYDDTEYIVTVEVVDNGEGQLVATVDYSIEGTEYGANVANFSNRYDVTTPVDVVLDVNKVADHEYLDNNTFTFTLTDGADLSETVSITGGGLVSFPALTYVDEDLTVHNNVQEYTYTITEENAGDGGVTYDAQPVTVTVVVQDNGEGAMEVVSVTYVKDGQSTTENATFTNTYLAAPVTIDLAADKTLTGQVLEDGQFTFELSGDGIDTQTKTNNQNGVVDFDEITYTEVGTHTYTISEVAGNAGGMAYDETVYTVTVVVTDDQEGQLLADVTYSVGEEVVETASFNNAYTATDVTLDLEVNKVADHEYLQDNEFTFVLTGEGLEDEKSVTGTGSVSFDTITYTDEDLTVHNNVQEYTYTITEVNSGDGGVTYDVQPVTVEVVVQDNGQGAMEVVSITYTKNDVEVDNATFTNTYLAAPVTIDLAADKTLTGQVLEADQFTFELVGDTTDTQTKTNDVDGVVDFDEITYTEVGTHTYTISEVAGDAGGMAYDETVYTVTVVVTDDQEGQLLADITYSVGEDEVETASFNNAYTATDVTLDLEVNKVADHEYLQDNEFTFVLTGEGIVDEKSVTGTDSVNFDTITYTDEDLTVHDNIQEYTYTITEVNAGDGGVTYDAQPVTVTVVVRDNGEGAMVVDSVTYTKDDVEVENATFTNTYQAAPVSTAIEVSKDLTGGKPLEAEQFIFYLIQNGEVIAEATNTADGNVTFEAIEYTTVGTYNYTVRELGVLEDGILYDESEFDIYVEVIDDTEGQLVATVNYPEDTEFDNVYKKVSVGDYVWIDENNNGLQDETDTPLEGIVLEITDLEGNPVTDVYGNPVGPVTTDENGHYEFVDLPADKTYVVTINQEESEEALLGLMPTIETEDDHEIDSSTWTATSEFLPNDGDHDPTLDFGFVREKVSVGDYVWIDENNDGLQDETDTPLEGIVLEITDLEGNPVTDVYGNPVGPVTTDENGHYEFVDLPADKTYVVTINQEESEEALLGLMPTIETEGNREIDSSTWTATSEFLPNDGDHDPTLDFGFVREKVSVGDYVWIDENNDGLQDETDTPLEGIVLEITDLEGNPVTDVYGNPVGPVTTDENGHYEFVDLPADKTYVVTINQEESEEALLGLMPTIETEDDHEIDSSTWTATSEFLPNDGDHDPTLDFGFVREKVSVGDYVWIDENNDGLQDETDTPLEGIVLEITDLEGNPVTDVYGNPVGPVTTDENGHYVFENLPADKTYVVTINQEESEEALLGLMPTIETEDDRENDSSTWTATSEFLPNDGDHDPTLDFGFVREKVSVGDYVWIDENNDGLQDETDTPLEGIVLEITDLEGNPVTDVYGNPVGPVTTDENGHYVFENLPADKAYVVTINIEESAEALEGLVPTIETEGNREIDSSTWTATSEFLPNDGDHDPTLDFGFTRVPEPTEPSEPTDPTEPSKSTEVDSGDVSVTGESSTRNISLIVIAMAVVVALILRRRLNKA